MFVRRNKEAERDRKEVKGNEKRKKKISEGRRTLLIPGAG
jgi:hypothetical protein